MTSLQHLPPTLLINPTALAIIDALFRVPNSMLTTTNPSRFTKLYSLSQPRVSKMMQGLGALDLPRLKKCLADIPLDWWTSAMLYPRTRQRLSSYFFSTQLYRITSDSPVDMIELLNIQPGLIAPGPMELAKHFGFIADPTIHIWCETAALQKVKAALRLSPAERKDVNTISIAVPSQNLLTESISTAIPQYVFKKLPTALDGLNIIRSIWDLGFGDARLREIQPQLLKIFLDEKL